MNNPKITQALDALIAAIREDLLSRVEVQFNPFAGNGKLFSTRLPAAKTNGANRNGKRLSMFERTAQIRQLFDAGKSCAEIAAAIGMKKSYVYILANKGGMVFRDRARGGQ